MSSKTLKTRTLKLIISTSQTLAACCQIQEEDAADLCTIRTERKFPLLYIPPSPRIKRTFYNGCFWLLFPLERSLACLLPRQSLSVLFRLCWLISRRLLHNIWKSSSFLYLVPFTQIQTYLAFLSKSRRHLPIAKQKQKTFWW